MNKMEEMVIELMPTKEFNRLLDHHVGFVKKTMTKQKSFQPMLILTTAKGNVLPCMFEDLAETSDGRVKQMEDVGRKMVEMTRKDRDMIVMAMFVSEVWYAMGVTAKDALPPEITLPLKDSPVKAEGIAISGTTLDGRQNMAVLPIMRAKDGTPMIVEAKIETSYCEDGSHKNDESVNYIMRGFWRGYLTKMIGK